MSILEKALETFADFYSSMQLLMQLDIVYMLAAVISMQLSGSRMLFPI